MGIGAFLILVAVVIFILGFRGSYKNIPPFSSLANLNIGG